MNNFNPFDANPMNQVFQNLDSKEKLDHFLKQNEDQNEYCKFIFKKKALPIPTEGRVEEHHIIPLHAGGPEFDTWNLLILSFDDHTHAHYLLSNVYESKVDQYVYLWRSGLTKEARRIQREYAKTKSVFTDSEMQAKFGRRGGSTWTLKREEAYIKRQTIYAQKAFENGMIWYYKPENILIRVSSKKIKLISQLVPFLKKRISYLISDDKREISVFSASLSRVINGKSLNTYNGFFLTGIVTTPFININFNLRYFYTNISDRITPFKNKFKTDKEMRQNIGKNLGKRSSSVELIENLKYTTVWYYKKQDLTVEIKPCQGVKELVEKLETYINVTYTDKEKKQFSALIKNKIFNKTRKGWVLKEIKNDSK